MSGGEKLENRKLKGKYMDKIPEFGKTLKTPEKPEKQSNSEQSPKIFENNKYYFKIPGEIEFQKFNPIFKLKKKSENRPTIPVDTKFSRIPINSEKY